MKVITFNFNHPVKGNVTLSPVNDSGGSCIRIKVESSENNFLQIPVNHCNEGAWKLVLDWEHEGRLFSHQENFEVKTENPQ